MAQSYYYDLTKLGTADLSALPIFEGFKNLYEVVLSPPREMDNSQQINDLHEESLILLKAEESFYKGEKPLYERLLSLKAEENQVIGQKILNLNLWEHVPADYRPQSGDRFKVLYDLRDSLKDKLSLFSWLQEEKLIKAVNLGLTDLEYELRILSDGNAHKELLSLCDPKWLDLMSDHLAKSSPTKTFRWGDVSSSSEDEIMLSAISSLQKKSDFLTPGIDLPGDFGIAFPMLDDRIRRFCTHHNWDVRYAKDTLLRAQGLILFSEEKDGSIRMEKPNDSDRVALGSLYASVASLFIQPQSLVGEDNTEVAVTYVCSLIAQMKLSEGNKDYLKIALKNGDGGKAVLNGRFYSLTKTGSSAIKLVIEAVDKLLHKFARELKEDQLNASVVQLISSRAFTSLDGMMDNTYRISLVDAIKVETEIDKRGKSIKVKKAVKRQHKVVPDLSVAKFPLKPAEISKVNELKEKFNNRKAVIEKRLSKVTEPTIFTQPKLCYEVVHEAYAKLQGFKAIQKDRMAKIREGATALNSGNKPGPGHWAMAKAEVMKTTSDIPQVVWDDLKWTE
jgi:uncharacterized protein YwgA